MEKEKCNPFAFIEDKGLMVLFDGTCGFEIYTTKVDGREDMMSMRIWPLMEKQEPSDRVVELNKNDSFVQLTFGTMQSLDMFISSLNTVKEHFEKKFANEGKDAFDQYIDSLRNNPQNN